MNICCFLRCDATYVSKESAASVFSGSFERLGSNFRWDIENKQAEWTSPDLERQSYRHTLLHHQKMESLSFWAELKGLCYWLGFTDLPRPDLICATTG
jgi:hypothetical protein